MTLWPDTRAHVYREADEKSCRWLHKGLQTQSESKNVLKLRTIKLAVGQACWAESKASTDRLTDRLTDVSLTSLLIGHSPARSASLLGNPKCRRRVRVREKLACAHSCTYRERESWKRKKRWKDAQAECTICAGSSCQQGFQERVFVRRIGAHDSYICSDELILTHCIIHAHYIADGSVKRLGVLLHWSYHY